MGLRALIKGLGLLGGLGLWGVVGRRSVGNYGTLRLQYGNSAEGQEGGDGLVWD